MTESTPDLVIQQVASHPFVRGLDDGDITVLQALATPADFAARDVIFDAGDPAESFYLIRTGVVDLRVPDRSGVGRSIQMIQEGSALGWSWLFDPPVWQFTAVASTPVRALAFNGTALRAALGDDPARGYRILMRVAYLMAERLHASRRQLLQLTGN